MLEDVFKELTAANDRASALSRPDTRGGTAAREKLKSASRPGSKLASRGRSPEAATPAPRTHADVPVASSSRVSSRDGPRPGTAGRAGGGAVVGGGPAPAHASPPPSPPARTRNVSTAPSPSPPHAAGNGDDDDDDDDDDGPVKVADGDETAGGLFSRRGFSVKADLRRRRANVAEAFKADARAVGTLSRAAMGSAVFQPLHAAKERARSFQMGAVYDQVYVPRQKNLSEVNIREMADASMDTYKATPIPLINGKRRRFVDDAVLPPVQAQQSLLDKIAAARAKADAEELEAAIAQGEKAAMAVKKDTSIAEEMIAKSGSEYEKKMIEAARARDAAAKRTFLRGQERTYGKGRLTSTHNLMGHIDAPWEHTSGKYKPLPGVGY
jgi:hypothetical protein